MSWYERSGNPDAGIPLENIDEPIEFYTQQNNTMKKGDKVLIKTDRPNVADLNGLHGIITAIDSDDNRTIFPYYVESDGFGHWFKENEVTADPTPPKDNAPAFITVCVAMVIAFYGLLAACNAPEKAPKKADTVQYLSPGQIPADNLKDTLGGNNGR